MLHTGRTGPGRRSRARPSAENRDGPPPADVGPRLGHNVQARPLAALHAVHAEDGPRLEVEQKEHEIISAFLPKQLGEEETKNICNEIIKKLNATSIKDMGKVMGALKNDFSDNLDFAKAGSYLKEKLNKK